MRRCSEMPACEPSKSRYVRCTSQFEITTSAVNVRPSSSSTPRTVLPSVIRRFTPVPVMISARSSRNMRSNERATLRVPPIAYQHPSSTWAAAISERIAGERKGLDPTYCRKCSANCCRCGSRMCFSIVAPTVECIRMAKTSLSSPGSLEGGTRIRSITPPRSLKKKTLPLRRNMRRLYSTKSTQPRPAPVPGNCLSIAAAIASGFSKRSITVPSSYMQRHCGSRRTKSM